jgi:hypothetical protein
MDLKYITLNLYGVRPMKHTVLYVVLGVTQTELSFKSYIFVI